MDKILILEDNTDLRDLFRRVLEKNGYYVRGVDNGVMGLQEISTEYFDCIISDIMMPEMDGFDFVSAIREKGILAPVLMITAKDGFDDMQHGFDAGIDDYLVKPVNLNEMVLRVGSLIRRAKQLSERRLIIGKTSLDIDSLTVCCKGEAQVLPQKEFMLLYKMATNPGKIFTRQQLMDDIWGYDADDTHTVDVHIGRLRERFKDCQEFKIVTLRGLGYKVVLT